MLRLNRDPNAYSEEGKSGFVTRNNIVFLVAVLCWDLGACLNKVYAIQTFHVVSRNTSFTIWPSDSALTLREEIKGNSLDANLLRSVHSIQFCRTVNTKLLHTLARKITKLLCIFAVCIQNLWGDKFC